MYEQVSLDELYARLFSISRKQKKPWRRKQAVKHESEATNVHIGK